MPKKIIAFLFAALLMLTPVVPALVQTAAAAADGPPSGIRQLKDNLVDFGKTTSLGTGDEQKDDLKAAIANIINIVLGFLGIIAVIIIITSGFKWMTAGGNEQTITEARGHIKNAVIGLVIVLTSYIIVNFAVSQLSRATGGDGGGSGQSTSPTNP